MRKRLIKYFVFCLFVGVFIFNNKPISAEEVDYSIGSTVTGTVKVATGEFYASSRKTYIIKVTHNTNIQLLAKCFYTPYVYFDENDNRLGSSSCTADLIKINGSVATNETIFTKWSLGSSESSKELTLLPGVYHLNVSFQYMDSCDFTISSTDKTKYADQIELYDQSLKMYETKSLVYSVTPDLTVADVIYWTSSDPNVVKVSEDGKVTAVSPGTAEITADLKNGNDSTCEVTVEAPLELDKENIYLNVGKTTSIEYDLQSNYSKPTWSSSNTNVVTVDSKGKLKAKALGVSTITATLQDNIKTTCTVIVNRMNVTCKKGKTLRLKLKGITESISWSSSKKAIVKVSKTGKVKALKAGKATITAKAGKYTFKYTIKVK